MTFSAPLPASGKTSLQFVCKLCGKQIQETATASDRQFLSRFQHMRAKHLLDVHEFFKNWYEYKGGI